MRSMSFSEFNERHGEMRDRSVEENYEGFEIPMTCWSDYSGSVVEASNYEVLMKEIAEHFPNSEGFIELHGMFASSGIGYVPMLLSIEEAEYIQDVIENMEDYPVLDDEHMRELEDRILTGHFRDNAEHELMQYLENESDGVIVTSCDLEMLMDYVYPYCRENGLAYTETGCLPYIDWANLFYDYSEENGQDLFDFTEWERVE